MDYKKLADMVGTAISLAQHATELVVQVSDAVERSKAALSTTELETLTQMLEQSHQRSQAMGAALDERLAKIANP